MARTGHPGIFRYAAVKVMWRQWTRDKAGRLAVLFLTCLICFERIFCQSLIKRKITIHWLKITALKPFQFFVRPHSHCMCNRCFNAFTGLTCDHTTLSCSTSYVSIFWYKEFSIFGNWTLSEVKGFMTEINEGMTTYQCKYRRENGILHLR